MHSSRMRTGRSLTICCSLLPGGGVCSGGGGVCSGGWSCSRGGVPGPGGVCLVRGEVMLPGGCAWSRGVSALGGWQYSQHALRQTPSPPVDRILDITACENAVPWPNFVAAGKFFWTVIFNVSCCVCLV